MESLMKKIQKECLNSADSLYKVIADTVMKNLYKLNEMSISEMAKLSFTTPTSITRFANKMGCSGYKELKTRLFYDIQNNQTINQNTKILDLDQEKLLETILHNTIDSIQWTLSNNKNKFTEVISEINLANKIVIYSTSINGMVAKSFNKTLLMMGYNSSFFMDTETQMAQSENTNNKTLAFLISTSGSTKQVVHCGEKVKKAGTKIISITSNVHSEIGNLSNIILDIKANDTPGRNVNHNTIWFVINLIISILLSDKKNKKNYDNYKKNILKLTN